MAIAGTRARLVTFEPTGPITARNVQDAIAEAAAGGGGGVVERATVTLDDAQIKNLSAGAAPYAVAVAAPGAGKTIIPQYWTVRSHVVAGYTNRDADTSLYLAAGDLNTEISEHIDAAALLDAANDSLAGAHGPFLAGTAVTLLDDLPLHILLNSNSGALTGGDAANTLTVTVLYHALDL